MLKQVGNEKDYIKRQATKVTARKYTEAQVKEREVFYNTKLLPAINANVPFIFGNDKLKVMDYDKSTKTITTLDKKMSDIFPATSKLIHNWIMVGLHNEFFNYDTGTTVVDETTQKKKTTENFWETKIPTIVKFLGDPQTAISEMDKMMEITTADNIGEILGFDYNALNVYIADGLKREFDKLNLKKQNPSDFNAFYKYEYLLYRIEWILGKSNLNPMEINLIKKNINMSNLRRDFTVILNNIPLPPSGNHYTVSGTGQVSNAIYWYAGTGFVIVCFIISILAYVTLLFIAGGILILVGIFYVLWDHYGSLRKAMKYSMLWPIPLFKYLNKPSKEVLD